MSCNKRAVATNDVDDQRCVYLLLCAVCLCMCVSVSLCMCVFTTASKFRTTNCCLFLLLLRLRFVCCCMSHSSNRTQFSFIGICCGRLRAKRPGVVARLGWVPYAGVVGWVIGLGCWRCCPLLICAPRAFAVALPSHTIFCVVFSLFFFFFWVRSTFNEAHNRSVHLSLYLCIYLYIYCGAYA